MRQALYMPALAATRFNPNMKAKYQALVASGKPPKVAITAIMRKLMILANVLLKASRSWIAETHLIITDTLAGKGGRNRALSVEEGAWSIRSGAVATARPRGHLRLLADASSSRARV